MKAAPSLASKFHKDSGAFQELELEKDAFCSGYGMGRRGRTQRGEKLSFHSLDFALVSKNSLISKLSDGQI